MLNVGIVGLGVGEAHIAGFEAHPGCQVKVLCDFKHDVVERMSLKYPRCRFVKEADEVLTDPSIDVVSIASWDNFHYEQIIKALENNKHVFVEKPLCLYMHELTHIFDMLEQNPHLKISSNLILRKSPRFIDLKKSVVSGALGFLSYVTGSYNYGRIHKITEGWRGDIDFYSVVCGGGIHVIDLMHWITGARIAEVGSFANNIQTKESQFTYNDLVAVALQFDNGLVGTLSVNFGCVFPHFHQFEVYGTKATFVNGLEYGLLFQERGCSGFQKLQTKYPGVHKGDLLFDFIESIRNDGEPEVSKEDIYDAMAVCFAIENSIKNHAIEKVKLYDGKIG